MENEIWKDAVGYESHYQVSNLGRVRNIRGTICSTTQINIGGVVYAGVKIICNKETRIVSVHNLVANAFLRNTWELPYVLHKNGDCLDNRLRNLKWCTEEEFYLLNTKNRAYNKGRKVKVFTLGGQLVKKFNTIIDALEFLGISVVSPKNACSVIDRCCNGKQATAYGYKWKYA